MNINNLFRSFDWNVVFFSITFWSENSIFFFHFRSPLYSQSSFFVIKCLISGRNFHHAFYRKFPACKQDSNSTYQSYCSHQHFVCPEVPEIVFKSDFSRYTKSSFRITTGLIFSEISEWKLQTCSEWHEWTFFRSSFQVTQKASNDYSSRYSSSYSPRLLVRSLSWRFDRTLWNLCGLSRPKKNISFDRRF